MIVALRVNNWVLFNQGYIVPVGEVGVGTTVQSQFNGRLPCQVATLFQILDQKNNAALLSKSQVFLIRRFYQGVAY